MSDMSSANSDMLKPVISRFRVRLAMAKIGYAISLVHIEFLFCVYILSWEQLITHFGIAAFLQFIVQLSHFRRQAQQVIGPSFAVVRLVHQIGPWLPLAQHVALAVYRICG